jgi:hypothetical protein
LFLPSAKELQSFKHSTLILFGRGVDEFLLFHIEEEESKIIVLILGNSLRYFSCKKRVALIIAIIHCMILKEI